MTGAWFIMYLVCPFCAVVRATYWREATGSRVCCTCGKDFMLD